MIREAACVGVVFANDEAALMVEQSVENIGRLVGGRRDHVGVIGAKLIGKMGVELYTRVLTIVQVHQSVDFASAAGAKELCIRGRGGAAAAVSGQGLAMLHVNQGGKGLRIAFLAHVPISGP